MLSSKGIISKFWVQKEWENFFFWSIKNFCSNFSLNCQLDARVYSFYPRRCTSSRPPVQLVRSSGSSLFLSNAETRTAGIWDLWLNMMRYICTFLNSFCGCLLMLLTGNLLGQKTLRYSRTFRRECLQNGRGNKCIFQQGRKVQRAVRSESTQCFRPYANTFEICFSYLCIPFNLEKHSNAKN